MAIVRRWYRVEVTAIVRGRDMRRSFVIEAPGPNEARRTVYERMEMMEDPEVVEDFKVNRAIRVR